MGQNNAIVLDIFKKNLHMKFVILWLIQKTPHFKQRIGIIISHVEQFKVVLNY